MQILTRAFWIYAGPDRGRWTPYMLFLGIQPRYGVSTDDVPFACSLELRLVEWAPVGTIHLDPDQYGYSCWRPWVWVPILRFKATPWPVETGVVSVREEI